MPIIQLYANLRKSAGTKELPITGSTLGEILDSLESQIPALKGLILEDGQIRSHFVITINGHNVTKMDAPVIEQDLIAIFPPLAGG